ncbi:MAG: twin-arginine translocation signal domain-containing protein [Chloroflexi bacterium]|nr:MAG: twin-arginine translocation signal domain-containing protein [Chloroflexota bacterium]
MAMQNQTKDSLFVQGEADQAGINENRTGASQDDKNQTNEVGRSSKWSRRRFLGGVAAGVGLLAVGCGSDDPTPTPTKTPLPATAQTASPVGTPADGIYNQHLPFVRSQALSPVAQPTLTPTPPKVAEATPVPPTETPVATPFPPGPPSKLGIFVSRNDPQLFELLATGGVAVVKTLELDVNFAKQIKETSPRTKLIGRIDLPQLHLDSIDPLTAARSFVDALLVFADDGRRRETYDGWEAYNEPVAGNGDEMAKLADFEAERIRLLAERGIRSVIGNFGTGQPPLEMWERFLPALQATKEYDGWLGLHEYSAPTIYHLSTRDGAGRYPGVTAGDTGWLTLRYRQVYNQILRPAGLEIPLVMTEMGVDGLVAERPGPLDARGWIDFQQYWADNGYGLWGPGAYVEQLVWYDQAMQQDAYVLGGTIYALAASPGWQSYEIGGVVTQVLKQYLSVHAGA